MSKFNRKFNSVYSRLSFWQSLIIALNNFEVLLKSGRNLTPDDVKTLNLIHRKLYECYNSAKDRLQIHKQRINKLEEEYSIWK